MLYKISEKLIEWSSEPAYLVLTFLLILLVAWFILKRCKIDSRSVVLKWFDLIWIVTAIFGILSLSMNVRNDWYTSRIQLLTFQKDFEILRSQRYFNHFVEDVACHLAMADDEKYNKYCLDMKSIVEILGKQNFDEIDFLEMSNEIKDASLKTNDDLIMIEADTHIKSMENIDYINKEIDKYSGDVIASGVFSIINVLSIILMVFAGALRLLKSIIEILDGSKKTTTEDK